MIVKNESHIIEKTLQNIIDKIPSIQYYVICDTCSTDNTISIIHDFFSSKNIKGELHQTPWVDFGYNRSDALEKAYNKTDYLLIFDADDSIEGEIKLPELTLDGYHLTFGPHTIYNRVLLVNNRLKWKFVGVLHEYIQCISKDNPSYGTIEGDYHLISGKNGGRSHDPNKYYKDALTLEKGYLEMLFQKDPLYVRYSFYTAQSYRDCDNKEKSIEWYKKRIEHGGWNQEVYVSYLNIGYLYMNQNNDEKALYYWMKGIEIDIERYEIIYEVVKYWNQKKNYLLSYGMVKTLQNIQVTVPKNKLFLCNVIHEYLFFIEVIESMQNILLKRKREIIKNEEVENIFIFYIILFQKELNSAQIIIPDIIKLRIIELFESIYTYINLNNKLIYQLFQSFLNRIPVSEIKNTHIKIISNIIDYYGDNLLVYKHILPKPPTLSNNRPVVFLSITTCKRYDLFEKTMNSFIEMCNDFDLIDYFYCVDDQSSEEDCIQMKEKYPFFNFYFKNIDEKGHKKSMNLIWDKLNELKPKYWIHLEDDWLFVKSFKLIESGMKFLENYKSQNIRQLLFNKIYCETYEGYCRINGGKVVENNQITIHEYIPNQSFPYTNCHYWPHYSFRPSMICVESILELGNYNDTLHFFEREYANKYEEKGYKSAFLNQFMCKHIGKLTSERDLTKSSYHLNKCLQFQTKFVIGVYLPSFTEENRDKLNTFYSFLEKTSNTLSHSIIYFGNGWKSLDFPDMTDIKEDSQIETTKMDYLITICEKDFERKIYTHVKNIIYSLSSEREMDGLLYITEPYSNIYEWNEKLHDLYIYKKETFNILYSLSNTNDIELMKKNIHSYDIISNFIDTDIIYIIEKENDAIDEQQWTREKNIYKAFSDFLKTNDEIMILFFNKITVSYNVHQTIQNIYKDIKNKIWTKISNIGWVVHRKAVQYIMNNINYKKTIENQLEEIQIPL